MVKKNPKAEKAQLQTGTISKRITLNVPARIHFHAIVRFPVYWHVGHGAHRGHQQGRLQLGRAGNASPKAIPVIPPAAILRICYDACEETFRFVRLFLSGLLLKLQIWRCRFSASLQSTSSLQRTPRFCRCNSPLSVDSRFPCMAVFVFRWQTPIWIRAGPAASLQGASSLQRTPASAGAISRFLSIPACRAWPFVFC